MGFVHNQGGWNEAFNLPLDLQPNTEPFCLAISWNATSGEAFYYLNGARYYKRTGALALAGSLVSTITLLGAFTTSGTKNWTGPIGYCALFNQELTEAQIAMLSNAQQFDPVAYDDGFTIVHLADAFQGPGSGNGTYWEIKSIAQWIVDNATKYNIKGVVYSGDVVEVVGTAASWAAAKVGFDILDAAEIPYHVTTGNHDYTDLPTRTKASFDTDYPQSRYTGHAWFNGDFYEASKSENAYWEFSYGGVDYIVIGIEVAPRAAVKSWLDDILAANTYKKIIIYTHYYMDQTGALDATGQDLWDNVIKGYDNVLLVCCGHYWLGNASRRTDNTNGGTPVHQMFLNGHSGYPYIRFVTVRPAAGKIEVQTFNPLYRRAWDDDDMQFEIDI